MEGRGVNLGLVPCGKGKGGGGVNITPDSDCVSSHKDGVIHRGRNRLNLKPNPLRHVSTSQGITRAADPHSFREYGSGFSNSANEDQLGFRTTYPVRIAQPKQLKSAAVSFLHELPYSMGK